jgi:hypothetical protein
MATVLNRAGARRLIPLLAMLFAVSACESPNAAKSDGLTPHARAAIARMPADQRAAAERLFREIPHMPPIKNPPAVYIDGERFTKQDPSSPYSVINPDLVAKYEVLGPEEGQRRMGPVGRNGVILITTRAAAAKAAAP